MKTEKKTPDFNEWKPLQQYRCAIEFLQTHLQLLDASLMHTLDITKSYKEKEHKLTTALNVDPQKYSQLNHPVKQYSILMRQSQKNNIEFSILRLYSLFTHYLKGITFEMFTKNPMLIVGKAIYNKDGEEKDNLYLTYAQIIQLQNYDNVQEHIVNKIFRSLEELKSTSKLLEKLLRDTKVNINKDLLNTALMYLEMRHLYIHNKGKADKNYERLYGAKFSPPIKAGHDLPTKFETFNNALKSISSLLNEIDKELIKHGLLSKREFKK